MHGSEVGLVKLNNFFVRLHSMLQPSLRHLLPTLFSQHAINFFTVNSFSAESARNEKKEEHTKNSKNRRKIEPTERITQHNTPKIVFSNHSNARTRILIASLQMVPRSINGHSKTFARSELEGRHESRVCPRSASQIKGSTMIKWRRKSRPTSPRCS